MCLFLDTFVLVLDVLLVDYMVCIVYQVCLYEYGMPVCLVYNTFVRVLCVCVPMCFVSVYVHV